MSILICFVLWCDTEFFVISTAEELSVKIIDVIVLILISLSKLTNQVTSHDVYASARYFASADDRAIYCVLFLGFS